MQDLKILNSREVKVIRKQIQEQFGCEEKFDYVFLQNQKDRIYIVNRDIERIDLDKLRINAMGLYFGSLMPDGFRLSIEGSQIVGKFATKNVLEVSDLQYEMWVKGIDFKIESEMSNYVLVKHNDDFVGCGKLKNGTLLNYVSKGRRLIVVNH